MRNFFDLQIKFLKSYKTKKENSSILSDNASLANNLFTDYDYQVTEAMLFELLEFFENDEFQILYYENDKVVSLSNISDMLKAEILNEDGWISRFSAE